MNTSNIIDFSELSGSSRAPKVTTHRGPLAGLSIEERNAVLADMDSKMTDYFLETLVNVGKESAHPKAPRHALADCLTLKTLEQLHNVARGLELKGFSQLNKAKLAEAIAADFTKDANAVQFLAGRLSRDTLEGLRAVLEAGGCIHVAKEDYGSLPRNILSVLSGQAEPLLYVFYDKGFYSAIIPNELIEILPQVDWEGIEQRRLYDGHLSHAIEVYTELCGIIAVEDMIERYMYHYPDEYNRQEFFAFVVEELNSNDAPFNIWEYNGKLYLTNWELAPYYLNEDLEIDLYNRMDSVSDVGQLSDDDLVTAACIGIVSQQQGMPVRKIPIEGFDDYDVLDNMLALPEAAPLYAFLDEHVPDDDPNDYYFADRALEELVPAIMGGETVGDAASFLADLTGIAEPSPEWHRLCEIIHEYCSAVPRWRNNGWSTMESLRFSGRNKVGRNDPCPCGSGKKYKRCCGK